jgi:putative tricarboxylic transport membrane protein
MRIYDRPRVGVGILALGLVVTAGCGTTREDNETSAEGDSGTAEPVSGLSITVPNEPGSGYDTTARAAAKAMEDAGLTDTVEVSNVPGAGGTVGLQQIVNDTGNEDLLLQMGLGLVGAVYTNQSEATLDDTTPVARLMEEAEAIVVPGDSPYSTLDELVEAWKADPAGVSVGGGSSPGGPDHLTPMLLAQAVGIEPTQVNYVAYDGGGELLAALLGSQVVFGATGVGEIAEQAKAGDLKILAVTSEQPVPDVDAPTLTESGVDLVFSNWRGLVAPPEISDDAKQKFIDLITAMHDSDEWKAALEENGWTDVFIASDEYATFLQEEDERVSEVLAQLGLA